ncbi:unnamed protein product [Cunninghamella echinulata]
MFEKQLLSKFDIHYDKEAVIDVYYQLDQLNVRDSYNNAVNDIVVKNAYDKAAKFACLYRDKIVCVDINNLIFYVYSDNRWRIDHGLSFVTKLVIRFDLYYGDKYNQRDRFIKDVAMHLYVHNFLSLLGRYNALDFHGISFDVHNGDLREGLTIDYTSLSTCHRPSHKYRQEVLCMLKDIFPDPNVLNYMLRFMGSLLIPGNRDKIFMVWSGTGNNGKSILMRLIELALNEYAVKLPTSLITGKRTDSGSATPDMAMLEKRLVAFLQEPSASERINIGMVKELTGNDTVYVRSLYEKGRNIEILAKMIYVVNATDRLAEMEKAVWNRIVVIPFVTTFVDVPRYSHERQRDFHLQGRLMDYAPTLLGIMIDEARYYLKEGLLSCSVIEETTMSVKRENDNVAMYLAIDGIDHSYENYVRYMKEFMPKEMIVSKRVYDNY